MFCCDRFSLLLLIFTGFSSLAIVYPAKAQIIPDNSLGSDNSVVTPSTIKDKPADLIEGGAVRDSNLFHSFSDFNVNNNNAVYFAYSAAQPSSPPLLTINLPVGLQFGTKTGQIINRSRFTNQNNVVQGLNISSEQSLSLIGGKVVLEEGYLSTSEGNIEIGSIAPQNTVKLAPDLREWAIDYEGVATFEDIAINQNGKIDAGVMGNSNIFLTGKNISLSYDLESISETNTELDDFFTFESLPQIDELPDDKVQIIANNTDSTVLPQISITAEETFSIIRGNNLTAQTAGKADAGAINVDADTVVIYGGGFEANTQINSSGNGGIVTFNANRMSVQNGGGGVNTSGAGDGGTINLNITNDLKIKAGGFGADTFDTGDGGKIEINAGNLEVLEGGAGVNTFGSGNGGTIDLNIANEFKVSFGGFGSDSASTGNSGKIEIDAKTIDLDHAGIGVNARNIGKGGQIVIDAETIFMENASINSQSGTGGSAIDFDRNQLQKKFGQKDAGNAGIISITADSLFLNQGGEINTKTFGVGNAGIIDLEVGYVHLEGDATTTINSSTQASGNGGNIKIVVDEINIVNQASITADSQETGNAGDININAKDIVRLQDRGQISVDGGLEGESGNM